MRFPGDVVSTVIGPGSVFLFAEETHSSTNLHYFVVLNHQPRSDPQIIMVHAQSEVEKRVKARANMPAETLAIVDKNDCPFLDHRSVFDCNSITPKTIAVLKEKFESGTLKMIDTVSAAVLQRLRSGVLASPIVDKETKRIVAP